MKTIVVRVLSQKRPGTVHKVTIEHDEEKGSMADKYLCTCEAMMFERVAECKHIEKVRKAWYYNARFTYDDKLLEDIVNAT